MRHFWDFLCLTDTIANLLIRFVYGNPRHSILKAQFFKLKSFLIGQRRRSDWEMCALLEVGKWVLVQYNGELFPGTITQGCRIFCASIDRSSRAWQQLRVKGMLPIPCPWEQTTPSKHQHYSERNIKSPTIPIPPSHGKQLEGASQYRPTTNLPSGDCSHHP